MLTLLFSARGRVRRGDYWMGVLGSTAAAAVIGGVAGGLLAASGWGQEGGAGHSPMLLLGVLLSGAAFVVSLWSGLCLAIKRLHDHGRSGAFVLLNLVPIANFWLLIELAFVTGERGPNAYGPDPLAGLPAPGAPVPLAA